MCETVYTTANVYRASFSTTFCAKGKGETELHKQRGGKQVAQLVNGMDTSLKGMMLFVKSLKVVSSKRHALHPPCSMYPLGRSDSG